MISANVFRTSLAVGSLGFKAGLVAATLVAATGCAADGSSDENEVSQAASDPLAQVDERSTRSDYRSEMLLHEGLYGNNWSTAWCPEGTYAAGFRQRVEPSQGSGDDTALNAISLSCASASSARSFTITPHPGEWGDWSNYASCPAGGFARGGQLKFESSQAGGDDTAANSIRLQCDGGVATADLEGKWGTWYPMQTCPIGSAVCGISVRFETRQGDRDDTALNGVKLYCCNL